MKILFKLFTLLLVVLCYSRGQQKHKNQSPRAPYGRGVRGGSSEPSPLPQIDYQTGPFQNGFFCYLFVTYLPNTSFLVILSG